MKSWNVPRQFYTHTFPSLEFENVNTVLKCSKTEKFCPILLSLKTSYQVFINKSDHCLRLDHPEEMWRNMYRYYRRRMAPKVDVRLVIAITITIISAVQVRI